MRDDQRGTPESAVRITESERLRLQLHAERRHRIAVTQQLLNEQLQRSHAEQQQLAREQADAWARLVEEYGLSMADRIDLATGEVTRVPAEQAQGPTPPPPPLKVVS